MVSEEMSPPLSCILSKGGRGRLEEKHSPSILHFEQGREWLRETQEETSLRLHTCPSPLCSITSMPSPHTSVQPLPSHNGMLFRLFIEVFTLPHVFRAEYADSIQTVCGLRANF
jgi:hypothetical protein